MARFGYVVAESLFVDCSWTDSLVRCCRRFVPMLNWLMLCGQERCFPGPLIRQIYPSLLVCVFGRVFGFENPGLRDSTLRNRQVAKALRHPFYKH